MPLTASLGPEALPPFQRRLCLLPTSGFHQGAHFLGSKKKSYKCSQGGALWYVLTCVVCLMLVQAVVKPGWPWQGWSVTSPS